MRRLILALLLSLGLAAPAAAGPAWWRVSDGRSVLWIMGVPELMPSDVKWDERALQHRLSQAERVYSARLGGRVVRPPRVTSPFIPRPLAIRILPDQTAANMVLALSAPYPIPIRPEARRMPPDLLARLKAQADKINRNVYRVLLDRPTMDAAGMLETWTWPEGTVLANPPAWRAAIKFQERRRDGVIEINVTPPNGRIGRPPEAVQQACLKQLLSQMESGRISAVRQAGLEAWASGDVENALKRTGSMQLCLLGSEPSTGASGYIERQAYMYTVALDDAFVKGGQSVAVVAFDPLLAPRGILDHYRRLGYEIRVTDGME